MSRKRNETKSTRRARESDSESQFLAGVESSSSPSRPSVLLALEERKRLVIEDLKSETQFVKDRIAMRFDEVLDEVKSLGVGDCPMIYDENMSEQQDIFTLIDKIIDDTKKNQESAYSHPSKEHSSEAASSHHKCNMTRLLSGQKIGMCSASSKKRSSRSLDREVHTREGTFRSWSSSRTQGGFTTPCNTKPFKVNIATVTRHPMETTKSPIVKRKVQPGETVISMSGSPLLVASDDITVPSVNIPLSDGRVFNFVARDGLQEQQLPDGIDNNTFERLGALRDFLNSQL